MNYEIRQFDTPLLRFSATEDTSYPEIEILWMSLQKASQDGCGIVPFPKIAPMCAISLASAD